VRDAVLRDHPWPFAKRRATLALVEEDPVDEWGYSYRVPSDCVYLRRLVSGTRIDTNDSEIEMELLADDAGGLIYTDLDEAEAEYTARITETARFHPDFIMAVSFRLAGYIAPRVCGSAGEKLGVRAFQMYALELQKAEANAQNETPHAMPAEADMIRVRS
jgi:hypothetical protein